MLPDVRAAGAAAIIALVLLWSATAIALFRTRRRYRRCLAILARVRQERDDLLWAKRK